MLRTTSNSIGRDLLSEQALTNEDCRLYYTNHTYGKRLVDWHVDVPMARGREVNFGDFQSPEINSLFSRLLQKFNVDAAVTRAAKIALIFGEVTFYALVDSKNPDLANPTKPLYYHKLKPGRDRVTFLSVDPIQANRPTQLDPLKHSYLRPEHLNVQWQQFHPSRCIVLNYGLPLFLSYSQEAFGYNGRSMYHNCFQQLDGLTILQQAQQRIINKTAVMMLQSDQDSPSNDFIQPTSGNFPRASQQVADNLANSTVGEVIAIGREENAFFLDVLNQSESSEKLRNDLLDQISAATDVPFQVLKSEKFASVMSEGSADFSLALQKLESVRDNIIRPAYEFVDRFLLGFISNYSRDDRLVYLDLAEEFSWNFASLAPANPKEQLQNDQLMLDVLETGVQLSGNTVAITEAFNIAFGDRLGIKVEHQGADMIGKVKRRGVAPVINEQKQLELE